MSDLDSVLKLLLPTQTQPSSTNQINTVKRTEITPSLLVALGHDLQLNKSALVKINNLKRDQDNLEFRLYKQYEMSSNKELNKDEQKKLLVGLLKEWDQLAEAQQETLREILPKSGIFYKTQQDDIVKKQRLLLDFLLQVKPE